MKAAAIGSLDGQETLFVQSANVIANAGIPRDDEYRWIWIGGRVPQPDASESRRIPLQ